MPRQKIEVYSYGKCQTCRNALRYLERKGLAYEARDIIDTPPSLQALQLMLAVYHGEIKKIFNTAGELYREMGLSKKLPSLSDAEALVLLAKHGKLIKRPFLVINGKAAKVGFKEDEWHALFP